MGFFVLVLWALLFTATFPLWDSATMWKEAFRYLITPSDWTLAGAPFALTAIIYLVAWVAMAIIVGGALWPSRRLALVSKLGAFLWFITLGVSWGTMIGEGVLFIFSPSTEWSIPLLATWVLVTGFALLMSLVLPAALANTYGKLGFYDL